MQHMYIRLSKEIKNTLIRRINSGESISKISREKNISRTILYRWLNLYNNAKTNTKNEVFSSKVKSLGDHWKTIPPLKKKEIINLAVRNPHITPKKISELIGISIHGVWTALKKEKLNTIELRSKNGHKFVSCYIRPLAFPSKIGIINSIKNNEKIAKTARKYGVSRTTIYKWLKRYKISGFDISSIKSKRPMGKTHWRFLPGIADIVLRIVIEHPEYSLKQLASEVSQRTGSEIGLHRIYNILKRNSLNNYQKRLYFAKNSPRLGPIT